MNSSADFDIQLANQLARLESYNKHLYRPNTYLHKWWARRCGSTFRFILKHLSPEENSRDYYHPGGLEGVVILDPMMGGGTTLHEAIRMGANVIGFDIDPIPVLQAKASLSTVESSLLEKAFGAFFVDLKSHLAPFFTGHCPLCGHESSVQFMLYGQKRRCGCRDVVMVDTLLLRQESNGATSRLCAHCLAVNTDEYGCDCGAKGGEPAVVTKKETACQICSEPYRERLEMKFYDRYEPVAAWVECPKHGSRFGLITDQLREALFQANEIRSSKPADDTLRITNGPKSMSLLQRGVESYADLFSSRQIEYLDQAVRLLTMMDTPAKLFLSLLVSTSLEFNSMLCGYKGAWARRAGAVRHVFSHHAFSIPYTALEVNPVFHRPTSGTLLKLFTDRIKKARNWSLHPKERVLEGRKATFNTIASERDQGEEVSNPAELDRGARRFFVGQVSAKSLPLENDTVDLVVTDPPYYHSVEYEDLSAFFRPWLQKMLTGEDSLDLEWHYRGGDSLMDQRQKDSLEQEDYGAMMSRIFSECRRVLRKDSGRMAFTFHHWDHQAWSALTLALFRSGFRLTEFHIVHSENPSSVHIANMRALTEDAILFFSLTDEKSAETWNRPRKFDFDSSAGFTRDCATLLGWLLENDFSEDQMEEMWRSQFAFQNQAG